MMYKIIIKGIPANLNSINRMSASARKIYRTLLSVHEKFLNLSAKRGRGVTKAIHERRVIQMSK